MSEQATVAWETPTPPAYHQWLGHTPARRTTPMSEHLSGFNNDWNRLLNRTIAAKGQLGRSLRTLAECNHSKAGFLLISLPESMNNIIDNLQTKGDLTFEDVHSRLLDLRASLRSTHAAMSWTACTDDYCNTHRSEKEGANYCPQPIANDGPYNGGAAAPHHMTPR